MVAIRETSTYDALDLFVTHNRPAPEPLKLERLHEETFQDLKARLSYFVWQGFFETLVPISLVEGVFTIASNSPFHRDWLIDHYLLEITDSASLVVGKPVKVVIIDRSCENNSAPIIKKKSESIARFKPKVIEEVTPILPLKAPQVEPEASNAFILESNPFNANYTFDSFVPGPSNQMAFTACSAIAEQASAQYSPLFLFGPVGIGKTHLIHAIGLSAKAQNSNLCIVYMSAEQWVNAYIQAIRERRFDAFRKKFRSSCDILLIDDIQFLAGKDASQDEFFHTFNCLHQARKQIVLTSDKYPHEIDGLEERLRTRLSWGLVADISPPEIETRIAILYKKAESLKINLPDDVAYYLASQVTSSVRELEGALLRLSVFLSVTKTKISLGAAKEYLSPVFKKEQGSKTSANQICGLVCHQYNLSLDDLKGKSRQQPIALARQVAMFLCRTHLSLSLPEIGRFFGGRDHSTVLSSIRKIEELKGKDISLQMLISKLEKEMGQSVSAALGYSFLKQ